MLRREAIRAAARLAEGNALRADLQTLGDRLEAELQRDGAAIPCHERGADLEDFVTVNADYLRHLRVPVTGWKVVLLPRADVHFAQDLALRHQRQRAIHGGA